MRGYPHSPYIAPRSMFPDTGFFFRPIGQVITPFVYDESLSIAQQIAKLFGSIRDLYGHKLSKDEFECFLIWLRRYLEDNDRYYDCRIKGIYDCIVKWLESQAKNELCWDVTQGIFENDVDAHRNMFNDLAIHAITVDELTERTDLDVDGLADCGLNVRGLAVYSWSLIKEYVPYGVYYDGDLPPASSNLTVRQLAEADVSDGYFVEDKQGVNLTTSELGNGVVSSDGRMRIRGDV